MRAGEAQRFIEELEQEFPKFRVLYKRESRLCHWIHRALWAITFGGQRHFLQGYYTVIGDTLYVPDSWDALAPADRVVLLRHERVHLRQRRRYGTLGMTFLYLVPWFPLGLAYGRARIEWEAYTETLRATGELLGREAMHDPGLRARIVQRFVGPDYGWMWPFQKSVERWYDAALTAIDRELGG
ncbi:MAG TPA: hypothetical protein VFQ35_08860 [Polyangiaceae bacterium]|nr:hypothetical protein [Polyangiaceae bacterium]